MRIYKVLASCLITVSVAKAASAVETSRCPAKISVNVEGIQALSDIEIEKQFEDHGYPSDIPAVIGLRDLLAEKIEMKNVPFVLYRKQRSQCGYRPKEAKMPNHGQTLNAETRLYTINGTNVLRIALSVSETSVVNAFAIVTNYSSSGMTIKSENKTGIYGYSNGDSDHRGVRFKIGNARKISVR